jgi:ABC-type Fe2+-enterobactin transport system substrate-binding protein
MTRKVRIAKPATPVAVPAVDAKTVPQAIGETLDGAIGTVKSAVVCTATTAKDTTVKTGKGIFQFFREVNEARAAHRAARLAEGA